VEGKQLPRKIVDSEWEIEKFQKIEESNKHPGSRLKMH